MVIELGLYFFIYAFLGWCTEVVYAALITGKFVNRGFLNGPLCPIYGFGVIAVVHMLNPVKDNLFILFIGSVFITSLLEFITGFVLEKAFHHRWWDYSDRPFNIGGYICALFSLMWGLACVLVVDSIHPLVAEFAGLIPETLAIIALMILSIVLSIDLIATVNIIFKLNKNLEHIEELSSAIRKSSDEIGENLANGAIKLADMKEEIEEKMLLKKEAVEEKVLQRKEAVEEKVLQRKEALEERIDKIKNIIESDASVNLFGHKRLFEAFPGLKSSRHKEALKALKEYLLKR